MKKGFASITIIYSFLLVFLLTLVSFLAIYTAKTTFIDSIVAQSKKEVGSISSVKTYYDKVGAGGNSYYINNDGKILAAGINYYGQLGINTTSAGSKVFIKTLVLNEVNFKSINAGDSHCLALDTNGNIWSWGLNTDSELGDGTATTRKTPTQITTSGKFVSVSAGYSHSLAVDVDGNIWSWGDNLYSRLGDGTTTTRTTPTQITTSGKFVNVSAGGSHSLALDKAGNIWAWGYNASSRLGDGTTTTRTRPTQITTYALYHTRFVNISAGYSHSLALDKNGNVWAWGYNANSRLGDGTTTTRTTPTQITTSGKFVNISGGNEHSLALDVDGNIWSWGSNINGRLGDGTSTTRTTPTQISNTLGAKFAYIAAGYSHSVASDIDGYIWTWGSNTSGKLGNNSTIQSTIPISVVTSTFRKITCGTSFSAALDTENNLFALGYNDVGQIGNNTTIDVELATKITNAEGTKFIDISSSDTHTIAIDINKKLWGWGNNGSGKLGDGTTANKLIPTKSLGPGNTNFIKVSAGYFHSMAIDESGVVWTWGSNTAGQLGDGTTITYYNPASINIPESVITNISAGNRHSLALDTNGNIWAWGTNNLGELGDGTKISKRVPTLILHPISGRKFSKISAGYTHSMAIDEYGALYTWGANDTGQLGDGTIIEKIAPTLISHPINGRKFSKISAGYLYSMAIDEYGALYTWGNNQYGKLGDGTAIEKQTPTLIANPDGVPFVEVSASKNNSYAIDENGQLWGWGYNFYYQLGTGDTTNSSVPIKIYAAYTR